MEKLSVAIADDNEIMLQLLGDIIESDDELNVVGTAKDKNKRAGYRAA